VDELGKLLFGNLVREFGEVAAPVIRRVMGVLGPDASEKTVRKAMRQQGVTPLPAQNAAAAKAAADKAAAKAAADKAAADKAAAAKAAAAKATKSKKTSLAARPTTPPNPPRDTFTVTPEATPGYSTKHRSDVQEAPFAVREDYQRDASWLEDGEDVLYNALGMPQRTEGGIGAYINSAGDLEMNPVNVTGISIGDDFNRDAVLATEKLRGVVDAQEAMAGNRPVLDPSGNAMYFGFGRTPSAEEMEFFARNSPEGFGTTATTGGALTFPFDPGMNPQEAMEILQPWAASVPGAEGVRVSNVGGFYEPAMGRFDEDYNVVPSQPFSGEATMDALSSFANVPQGVATALGASPSIREVLLRKYARDEGAPTTRGDIQNTRKFFSEADWPRAVELIRQGVSPAAALAALGYSASSLAAPTPE